MLTLLDTKNSFVGVMYDKYLAQSLYLDRCYDNHFIKETCMQLCILDGIVGDLGSESDVELLDVGEVRPMITIKNYYTSITPKNNSFVFHEPTPTTIWIIYHNLGYMPSAPLVTDLFGNNIEGIVANVDVANTTITFSSPQAGYAYFS